MLILNEGGMYILSLCNITISTIDLNVYSFYSHSLSLFVFSLFFFFLLLLLIRARALRALDQRMQQTLSQSQTDITSPNLNHISEV